jgi:hypothetical protein
MKKSVNVFKKLGLFLLLALALLLLVRCEKEPIDPPKYIIEACAGVGGIISPSGKIEVVSGSNKSFTFTPDAGFKGDSISVNGKLLPLINNIYNLENITSDYKVEITPKKTLSWYLMNGEWKMDSIIIRELSDGITWSHYALWGVSGATQEAITFLPSGRIAEYWNGKYVGDSRWSINETTNPPTLNVGGEVSIIEKLDEVSLVLARYDMECLGCPDPQTVGAARKIYSHHN